MRRCFPIACAGLVAMSACADARSDGSFEAPEGTSPVPAGARQDFAREQPDSTRDEIARLLRLSASATGSSEAAGNLARARAQAQAYAYAWADSFLVRRVEQFARASAADRRALAEADSLWREGRVVVGQQGVPAAMRLWRESLRTASAVNDSAGRAVALFTLGAGFYMGAELDSASVYLEDAHDLATAIGDYRTMGNALGALANVSKDRGELSRAAELYAAALPVRARSGDSRGIAADQNNLGLVAWSLGDLESARMAFERVLALNRAEGRDRPAAVNLANLGDISSIQGDYASAGAYYEEALELNRAAGDLAETGFVLHHLGLLATRRGDYAQAVAALSEAASIHEQSGAVVDAIAVRADLAAVRAATGDFDAALAVLRRAQDDATAIAAPPATRAWLALTRADLALQFGARAEAEVDYGRADQLFLEAGDEGGRAEAQQGRALLLLLRQNYAGALQLLDLAARAQVSTGDRRAGAVTQVLVGDVHRQHGDTTAAREALTAAAAIFADLGDPGGEAAALSALGELELRNGAPLAAEAIYRRGLERIGLRRMPDTRWRLHVGLAAALRSRGAVEPAIAELHAAITAIETAAASLSSEERRSGFLADKWQVYSSLAQAEQARGRAAQAFAASERMRARQLLAMLERGRVPTRNPATAREQDLRRHISELVRQIEGGSADLISRRGPVLTDAPIDAALEALHAAQREYADLLLTMRETDPAYAQLVTPTFVQWRDVAARLRPDEVLLQYLVSDSASSVFVVTTDTVAALDLNVGGRTLANLVDFARHAMAHPGADTSNDLWPAALHRLHHYLMGPVEAAGFLAGRRSLVIVPHAELHYLPFGALLAGGPNGQRVVDRFELTYAPSASVWVRLGANTRPRSASVIAFAPYTDRLPASREEVTEIRSIMGRRNATVLMGTAASERALREAANRHGILHLATYGVLNKHNPLFSYIELAPDGSDDGRLEVHEVFDLELNGQLVVLSACQTAVASGSLADVPAGDDWVGLTQAFLQAGASGVLASLWPVDDRATAKLMRHFYQGLASGRSDAAALAEAQRAMARDSETAHPFYWAGFILSGWTRRE